MPDPSLQNDGTAPFPPVSIGQYYPFSHPSHYSHFPKRNIQTKPNETMTMSSNSDHDNIEQPEIQSMSGDHESHDPNPEFPEEAPDILETEDVDIHGKLAHLNALDLSGLTLHKRYAIITLAHPPYSDELGRFMTSAGAYPSLPALSPKETQAAIDSLIADGLIETWPHGGSTCWEVAGAYAFKKDLHWQLNERRKINKKKKDEAGIKRQRKKDAENGIPFVYEDDGSAMSESGEVHEVIRTRRGNLVPDRPRFHFNSNVPQRKGMQHHQMIVSPPSSTVGCILKMLPSFYPAEDLSALGAVIRFYLLMDCDDYGRVRVDAKKIHGQLGPAITKRVSLKDIEQELAQMQRLRHLVLIDKGKKGVFGYVRDAAQHMMEKKRYNSQIPKIYVDRELTYDSDEYKAFFKACHEHSAARDKVTVAQFSKRGDVTVVRERASFAAERYLKRYEKLISSEPYCDLTPEQFCGFGEGAHFDYQIGLGIQFLHGFKEGLSTNLMECLYLSDPEYFDGIGPSPDDHRILTHLIGMKPRDYITLLKEREEFFSTSDDEEDPLVVPGDPDKEGLDNAYGDTPPDCFPDDEDIPMIVP